jgi:prepilin-type N-terminal cleavage/methylation domain-containing protein
MPLNVRKDRGFTLIELLIVVAIIGLLAAIGVWNYLIALDRGRQKKTIADMRGVMIAWEQRAADYQHYNAAGAFSWPTVDVPYAQLSGLLTPTYIRTFPQRDGWNNNFDFGLDQPIGSPQRANVYAIRSRGRDGVADADYNNPGTTDFDCDIVFSNGAYVVYPERETQKR